MALQTRMRSRFWTACAAAALTAVTHAALAQGDADLPLQRVSLYRSGVGFFEHGGKVEGDAMVRLRFDTQRLNDVLKSFVALDRGGGRIAGAMYEPRAPLERRLERFRIDLENAEGVTGLLGQLRGVNVRLTTA